MNVLIKNREIVPNTLIKVADDAPLPASGTAIIPLARLQLEKSPELQNIGALIPNTADFSLIWPQIQNCSLIALEFPAFGDGRAYSQARLLRDRYGYKGDILATGAAVVRDQIFGMQRCGINMFELRHDQNPAQCLSAMKDFSDAYQPAADKILTVRLKRLAAT
ncbi:MAG: DUF934 domain-containing protein [Stenotrophobium sp.]